MLNAKFILGHEKKVALILQACLYLVSITVNCFIMYGHQLEETF